MSTTSGGPSAAEIGQVVANGELDEERPDRRREVVHLPARQRRLGRKVRPPQPPPRDELEDESGRERQRGRPRVPAAAPASETRVPSAGKRIRIAVTSNRTANVTACARKTTTAATPRRTPRRAEGGRRRARRSPARRARGQREDVVVEPLDGEPAPDQRQQQQRQRRARRRGGARAVKPGQAAGPARRPRAPAGARRSMEIGSRKSPSMSAWKRTLVLSPSAARTPRRLPGRQSRCQPAQHLDRVQVIAGVLPWKVVKRPDRDQVGGRDDGQHRPLRAIQR